jgi:hypothetical protein
MTADLKDLFDRAGRDAPAPALDLDAVLHRARRSRNQRRVWMSAVAVGVGAAAVAVVVLGGAGLRQAGPLPATHHPSPTPSLITLGDDPFLTPADISYWRVVRQDLRAQPRPSDCLSDPRTWGAAESGAQTYTDPRHTGLVINEFVLRYDDTDRAHRAVMQARQRLNTCRSPTAVDIDPIVIDTPSAGDGNSSGIAEYFGDQTVGADTVYTVRVARAGNILVVIEDIGPAGPGSNANVTMTVAVARAVHGSRYVAPPWCPQTAC